MNDENIDHSLVIADLIEGYLKMELTAEKQWDPLESTCRHASLSIL